MIVKYQTTEGWMMVGDVANVHWSQRQIFPVVEGALEEIVFPKEEKDQCPSIAPYFVTIQRHVGDPILLKTEGQVYLLNDNGKTIDRI